MFLTSITHNSKAEDECLMERKGGGPNSEWSEQTKLLPDFRKDSVRCQRFGFVGRFRFTAVPVPMWCRLMRFKFRFWCEGSSLPIIRF